MSAPTWWRPSEKDWVAASAFWVRAKGVRSARSRRARKVRVDVARRGCTTPNGNGNVFCGEVGVLLTCLVHGLALHLGSCGEAVDVDEAYGGVVVELVFGGVCCEFEVVERVGGASAGYG